MVGEITAYDLSENQRVALKYIANSVDGQIYGPGGVLYWQLQGLVGMHLLEYQRLELTNDEWCHKFVITPAGTGLAQSLVAQQDEIREILETRSEISESMARVQVTALRAQNVRIGDLYNKALIECDDLRAALRQISHYVQVANKTPESVEAATEDMRRIAHNALNPEQEIRP